MISLITDLNFKFTHKLSLSNSFLRSVWENVLLHNILLNVILYNIT